MVEFNDLWPIFLWILLGLIIFYIFPIILMISVLSLCTIVIFIYGLLKGIHREPYSSPKWDGARRIICRIFEIYGKIWYGYEIDEMNFDQIPSSAEGPALFIAYHGRPCFDIPFFIAQVFLRKKRLIHCVALRDNFKFPGLSHVVWAMGAFPGTTREECISKLKEGKLVLIAPGGLPECLKSSPKTYNFVWGNRLGFAKVALESKAPVITMFTENCRPPGFFAGFPVKLITHLGSPLKFDEDETPENVKELCMLSLSNLIQKHQQLPCTIFKAMRQRILKKKEYEEIREH